MIILKSILPDDASALLPGGKLKSWLSKSFAIACVMLALAFVPALKAQTFTSLHSLTGNDGANPVGLFLSGDTLFVTAQNGGSSGNGAVFGISTNGVSFTNLYSFSAVDPNTGANSDGASPFGGMISFGNLLFGTMTYGGTFGSGALSAVKTDGTSFTNLYSFSAADPDTGENSDGVYPYGGLIMSGNALYGVTLNGGSSGSGTVFKINTDGTGLTRLYSFSAVDPNTGVNRDGACPSAGLILSGHTLYGTAYQGGTSGNGTVFKVNTDGTGFACLHSFTATHLPAAGSFSGPANGDGACPGASLILSGNILYGTASRGGGAGGGTIFALDTNGSNFTTLHSFTVRAIALSGSAYIFSNSDGSVPTGNLVLSGNTLYGTASRGGGSGSGVVFALNTDGTGFITLHGFTVLNPNSSTNSDGASPSGLLLSGNTLYGTSTTGGSSGAGVVYSLSVESATAPQLAIACAGTNVILSWPATATGYTLQSTASLVPPVVWTNVNGQFAVTNQMSGQQQFYRLIK